MPDTSTVPTDVLEGLKAEMSQQAQMMGEPEDVPVEPDDEPAEEPEDTPDDQPAGFKSYEEYVADGGDPDFYRGPKAYEQQKEILSDLKAIKDKVKQRDDEMLKLQKLHERELQRVKDDLEAKKKQAREDLDFDAYERYDKQSRELDAEPVPQNQGEPEPIQNFRRENPKLNPADPEFDELYNAQFEAAFNVQAKKLQERAGRVLSSEEITRLLDKTQEQMVPQGRREKPRAPRVEGTKRTAKREEPVDKMPAEIRDIYKRWSTHHDPKKREQAETWLKQYS